MSDFETKNISENNSEGLSIGIDLGTTFSCVGYYKNNGQVDIIVNEVGNRTTPSFVGFSGNERLIGQSAKNIFGQNPANTIYDVKRLMGQRYSDKTVQKELNHLVYNVIDKDDKPVISVEYMNGIQNFTAEEISSMILSKLKEDAERYLGDRVTKAVITVPAYFNDAQRQATRDAGKIAGLDVMRIINEPTAAAIAYGLDKIDNTDMKKFLIYDIGGGTLDVTTLTFFEGLFTVKSTSGDTHLGGEDFDNKIKDFCFMKFCNKNILPKADTDVKNKVLEILDMKSFSKVQNYGSENIKELCSLLKDSDKIDSNVYSYLEALCEVTKLYENKKIMSRLKSMCETAKRALSSINNTVVSYDNFYNGEDLNVKISKARFEEMCKYEFGRALAPVDTALEDAGYVADDIDDVVLVGGSTRLPRIRELLEQKFPGKLRSDINPDEAVAYGAAINAAMIDTDREKDEIIGELILMDVTPLSLGLETKGGVMEKMIPRNTPLPAEFKQTFTTAVDNQPFVNIKVYEGERNQTKDNNLLGQFELHDIPPLPMGKAKIEVVFAVNNDGIMSITATELTEGHETKKIIRNEKGRLSTEDINRMIEDAEKHKENDRIFKEKIDAKLTLENYITSTSRKLSEQTFAEYAGQEFVGEVSDMISSIYDWLDDIEDDEDAYNETTSSDFNDQYKLLEELMLPMIEEFSTNVDINNNEDNEDHQEEDNVDNNINEDVDNVDNDE